MSVISTVGGLLINVINVSFSPLRFIESGWIDERQTSSIVSSESE